MSQAASVVRAEKITVYNVGGRPHDIYTGEPDKKPATAIEAIVGNRVRVLVPRSFPASPAQQS